MPVSHRPDILQKIRPADLEICRYIESKLNKSGFKAYLVGGSVRDLLLGDKGYDIDFTTDATPDQVMKIFPKTIPVGIAFGTVIVLYKGKPVEVTTFRTETEYADGRRPEKVHFGKSLEEDVARRDFTINGLAFDISGANLHDFVHGEADIKDGLVRTIGNPVERFREDGLRPIRGCRFAARLEFTLDAATEAAMRETLDTVSRVAPERFYDEWRKTLKLRRKDIFWKLLWENGIFSLFMPELAQPLLNENVRTELFERLRTAYPRDMGSYAALFFCTEGLRHSDKRAFFRKARFPQKEEKLCAELCESALMAENPLHNYDYVTVKRALSAIPRRNYFAHLRFIKEYYASCSHDIRKKVNGMIAQAIDILRAREPLSIADLAITGNHIMSTGITGKKVGEILSALLQEVLADKSLNNSETLLQLAQKYHSA